MKKEVSIAIIDDDVALASNLKDILEAEGYSVEAVHDGRSGIALFHENMFDLGLVDIKLPDIPGPELVSRLSRVSPETEYIMVTAHATVETAVEAIRQKQIVGYENKPVDMDHLLTFIREVMRRRRAEESLQQSELRYRTLFENNEFLMYITNNKGDILFANNKGANFFGQSQETIIGKSFFELRPDRAEMYQDVIDKILATGETLQFETVYPTPKEDIWLLVTVSPLIIDNDTRLQIITQDITDRKQTAEALRESEEKYRNILENMREGYYEVDLAGNFTFFNDAMCKIRGYTRDELMGMDNRRYMDPVTAKNVFEAYNQVYTTGTAIKGYEWETLRKDGTKGYVEVSASLMKNREDKPVGFRGIVRDVTARKFAEQEKRRFEDTLKEAQKMEAIATLAGGIAHEFNNALMGVMGNIELLKMELSENEKRAKYFEAMNESGHRMSRLTDQLLAYAEGGKYQPRDLRLDDFIIETLPILQHDLSSTIRIETHFPKNISYIRADHAQMQMVLSAILTNSNEAIEDEGLIRITAENKDIDEDFTRQHPGLKPGSCVCLTIEDDGKGMDEETKSGIFEPFFTTKFQGRGMGMAAVYGIVKNHDGWIYVDSELDKGTVVRIYLPAISAESREQGAKAATQPEVELAMGEGTILVIEDEEPLVGLFRQILERLGYRVLEARTGKEAVELAKTFDGQIDLALLDIKLPDMDGGRVYPLIMEARPDLKVIVCSGYSIDGPARAILDAGAEDFIQKPFSIAAFAEKLKEVLGD